MKYRFTIDQTADSGYRQYLQALLRAHNQRVSTVDGPDAQPLTIRVMDDQGTLLGGLVGLTYWGWLVIDVMALEPRTVTQLNDYDIMVVKVRDEFVWHAHADTDDFFLVLKGRLTIRLRDGEIVLGPGERLSGAARRRASALCGRGDAPTADRAERDTEHGRCRDRRPAPENLVKSESR